VHESGRGKVDIFKFAQGKLLCADNIDSGAPSYSAERGCAVLSQRLALDINTTGYVARGFVRDSSIVEKAQIQISNHMRVCMAIPQDLDIYGLAASEPILSEVASRIMRRNNSGFALCSTLSNVMDSYAISPGDRGELLVAAFFTWARDLYVKQLSNMIKRQLFGSTDRFCPVFSVVDFLSNLFNKQFHSIMLESLPSVYRMGNTSSPQKFGDVFRRTRMHYNHFIKPNNSDVINRQYLLNILARGAGALGANGQPGYDMIFPFLYETDDLDIKKVGFIMVQVKNVKSLSPRSEIMNKLDRAARKLLTKNDTVPVIRMVFSLRGTCPTLEHMTYSQNKGASLSPYTSYDFWCFGMGPGLLQPVDEDGGTTKWEELLQKPEISKDVFVESSNPDLRRSEHPGGGRSRGHNDNWVSESAMSPTLAEPKLDPNDNGDDDDDYNDDGDDDEYEPEDEED